MKSYTDLEQSKKLAEILPLESADMGYLWNGTSFCEYPVSNQTIFNRIENIPCWSLAALLAFLPNSAFLERGSVTELYRVTLPVELEAFDWYIEPLDACVNMIIKLHELNLL